MSKNPAVGVLFSAGIDSTVQIAQLLDQGYDVHPITFDDCSSMTRLKRDVALEFWLSYWDLHQKHIPIRYMKREELRKPGGFVPGWKMTMITNALAYCQARELSELHLGYLKDDRYPYPDENPTNMARVVQLYCDIYSCDIRLNLSIRQVTKAQLIRWGHDHGVPLSKTFSCRDVTVAGLTHCGRCDICRMRADAFHKAGVPDPSYYLTPPEPIPAGETLDPHRPRPTLR